MKLAAVPASAEDQSTAGPPDRAAVQIRPVRRSTAALWAATLLAALAVPALTLITWGDLKLSDGITSLYIPVAAAVRLLIRGVQPFQSVQLPTTLFDSALAIAQRGPLPGRPGSTLISNSVRCWRA